MVKIPSSEVFVLSCLPRDSDFLGSNNLGVIVTQYSPFNSPLSTLDLVSHYATRLAPNKLLVCQTGIPPLSQLLSIFGI